MSATTAGTDAMDWPTSAEHGVVILDNQRIQIAANSRVRADNLATFPGKGVFGDSARDPDNISSALILTSYTGGGQIQVANEASDAGRYWFGDLYGRAPNTLTLNRETLVTLPGGEIPGAEAAWGLGDLGDAFYGSFGTGVYRWDEGPESWERVGGTATMAGVPVADAVDFAGPDPTVKLYVPLGVLGYAIVTPSTVTNVAPDGTHPAVLSFTEWDGQLIALDPGGKLWRSLDGLAWAVAPGTTLDRRYRPRRLEVFPNSSQVPTVFIVTDRRMFSWDAENDRLFPVDSRIPAHPQNALASSVWRNQLFLSAGLEAYTYTGNVFSPMGPTRDQGLPAAYRGRIVSMWGELNGLYALVAGLGVSDGEVADTAGTYGEGMTDRNEVEVPRLRAASTLLVYDGVGWHADWVSEAPATAPTNVRTSEATSGARGEDYRVWWGVGGRLYTQLLPTDAHNPRQGRELGVDRFAASGYLDTPWYDMNSTAFKKLLSHVQLNLEHASETARVTVMYQTDYDTAYTPLGVATTRGATTLGIGPALRPVPTQGGTTAGLAVMRIRFRLLFERGDDPYDSPVLDAFILKYNLVPLNLKSWQFSVNVDYESVRFGKTAGELRDFIDEKTESDRLVTFVHGRLNEEGRSGGNVYRVQVSRATGFDDANDLDTGTRQVSVVEIPATVPTLAGQLVSP